MFNTARFFLSRLESLSAAPTSLSFLRFRSKSSKSSEGGQSWPLRAQWRDSVICSAAHSLHSTNPTDSPDSRFSVGALVVLSVCLCMWRKDRYLPYECQCVRHLPWTNVLACSMFVPAFRHCFAAPKVCPDHPSGERDSRFSVCVSLTFISRRKGCCVGYKFSKEMHLAAIASRCFYCTGNIA